MGYSISWIAVRGKPKARLLAELDLRDTNEDDEANESPVSGAELPGGWYVLFLNDLTHPYVDVASLKRLSTGCEVVGAQVEEHVMVSASFYYLDGRREWNMTHESDKGLNNLETDGVPPVEFSSSRDANLKLQEDKGEEEGVDYVFEVPLEVAESICGYRHDRWQFEWGEPKFTRLAAGRDA
jgi:hypothetical protein